MNADKRSVINEWIRYSNDDLYAAQHFFDTMQFPIYRIVCFNAQQSAEKYLKAYQIYFDIDVIKTHNLTSLVLSLQEFDEEILMLEKDAGLLSSFAVQYRYPDDFDDLTKEDAEKSLNIARIIQKFITGKIVL